MERRWPCCVGSSISPAKRLQDLLALQRLWDGGLTDRSRRPYRHANRLPFQIEKLIVQLRKEHPSWGAPKIREKLRRLHTEISLPAISTVHTVLDRHGLVQPRLQGSATKPKEPRLSSRRHPMIFGARTTKASSCSPIGAIAIRSPSLTRRAATCCACDASGDDQGSVRIHRIRADF